MGKRTVMVAGGLSEKIKDLQNAAQGVENVRLSLQEEYDAYRPLMGESKDLATFDLRFEGGLGKIENLYKAMDEYNENVKLIAKLYAEAQQEAILCAMRIPEYKLSERYDGPKEKR